MVRATDLLADLEALEDIYRALHPGLARYLSEGELAALFAGARRELARDQTLGEAFVAFTRLTAALKCGHSYPNFANQPRAIAEALLRGPRLPFRFRWLGDEMVVTDADAMPPGTVVESLGGVPARELLRALLPLARADGSNHAKRRAYLEVRGDGPNEAFEILAPLVFPRLWSTTVELAIRTPDGARRSLSLPTQPYAERAAVVAPDAPNAPLWRLELREHRGRRVGLLRMPSWVAYKTTWDWKAFVHATMRELAEAQVPGLVVDLRGNEGGNDVGDELIAHLIDRPQPRSTMARRVRFETVPAPLRSMLDTWDPSFFELGKEARDLGGGWRELPASDDEAIAPASPRYRGKVVVLVDAANSSATFQFASLVQRERLAVLVGSATGGNQRGINGGAFFFARLPRTKIEVDVPLIGTFPAGPAQDAGVTPDHIVEVTAAALAAGIDVQLNAALDLAR